MVSREKQFVISCVPPSHCPETLGGRRPRVDLGGVKKGVEMHGDVAQEQLDSQLPALVYKAMVVCKERKDAMQ